MMNDRDKHELKVACPVCKKVITGTHVYPGEKYDAAFENVNRHAIGMQLLAHMMKCGCLEIKETTPFERCHMCGEMSLWEEMYMHGEAQDVYCLKCYEECCYTGDWENENNQ